MRTSKRVRDKDKEHQETMEQIQREQDTQRRKAQEYLEKIQAFIDNKDSGDKDTKVIRMKPRSAYG